MRQQNDLKNALGGLERRKSGQNGRIFVFWRVWRAENCDFWPSGRFRTEKRHAAAKWDEHRVWGRRRSFHAIFSFFCVLCVLHAFGLASCGKKSSVLG